jgi:hypothetical protein
MAGRCCVDGLGYGTDTLADRHPPADHGRVGKIRSAKQRRCARCAGTGLVAKQVCNACSGWGFLRVGPKGTTPYSPAKTKQAKPPNKWDAAKQGILRVGGESLERWRHAPRERMARPVEIRYLSPEELAQRRKDAGLDP